MTNKVMVKRSAVPGKIPTTAQVGAGELAVNTNDKKLFFGTGIEVLEVPKFTDLVHAHALDDLSDVTLIAPAAGQTLVYNGSNWINVGSPGANGGGASKRIWSNSVTPATGTTLIVPGSTSPLSTEGTQIWQNTFSPLSLDSTYVIQTSVTGAGTSNNSYLSLVLFRNNIFIGGTMQIIQSSNNSATLSFAITDKPNTTQPVTYQARVGISTGQWYVNRRAAEVTYGGLNTGWVMWEY